MSGRRKAPAWAARLLRAALPEGVVGDSVAGDLQEEYDRRRGGAAKDARSAWRAGVWYVWQAARLAIGYGVWRRLRARARGRPGMKASGEPGTGRIRRGGLADLRQSARSLRRRPTYFVAAVATLAIGIGADTAIYSVVRGSLLQPLPWTAADRLVVLGDRRLEGPAGASSNMNVANFLELRERSRTFESMAAFEYGSFLVGGELDPGHVTGLRVTHDFFDVLGRAPRLGRNFHPEEDAPGGERVVILSEGLWRTRFRADPGIIGRSISLDLVPHTVVGVAAADVVWRADPVLWVPWAWPAEVREDRRRRSIFAVGRVRDGITPSAAIGELQSLFADIRAAHPERNQGMTVDGQDLFEWTVGWGRRLMRLLAAAAGLVLLIACVNVANLMLARAENRRGELGVRRALGASRGRLAWVFLSEGLLIGLIGGLAGIGIAFAGVRLILAAWGASIPRAPFIGVDGGVLAAAVLVSVVTGLVVGLAPAFLFRGEHGGAQHQGALRVTRGGGRVQQGLVILEVALAVMVVAAAGLLVNTAVRLGAVDLGIEAHGAVSFRITLPATRYGGEGQASRFFARLEEEIRSLPGVAAVGFSTRAPLSGGTNGDFHTSRDPTAEHLVEMRAVTPEWFAAMGQQLRGGRLLEPADANPAGSPTIVVNEALVRTMLPGADAAGQELRAPFLEQGSTIVGVVSDVRDFGPTRETRPTAYWAYGGPVLTHSSLAGVVRMTNADPASVVPAIRQRLAALDADVPIEDIRLLEDVAAATFGRDRRAALTMLSGFAALALALAVIGIYGVIAFGVEQRRRETGVRMALGATRAAVLRLVCVRGIRLAGIGVALGLAGSAFGGRLVAHLLWGVQPVDGVTLAATALLFVFIAVLASVLPARRASSFGPAEVLRQE